jgi:tRNA threonylcarbamoyladenosine biosynthesis protein TsaE
MVDKPFGPVIHTVELDNLEATENFGRCLAARLFPGAVLALIGPFGAGKTHLTRAIAEGLEIVESGMVTSPTFGLVHEYPARWPIYHFDAYRLKHPDEFIELGADEYFASDGVCVIEWADRVAAALPTDHLQIVLAVMGETSRHLTMMASGPRHAPLLESVRGQL